MRSLLAIASIHEFPIRSINFIPAFTLSDLDVDVFTDIPLIMGVDGNILEWAINLNKPLYGIKQASENWFDLLKPLYKGEATINIKFTLVCFT